MAYVDGLNQLDRQTRASRVHARCTQNKDVVMRKALVFGFDSRQAAGGIEDLRVVLDLSHPNATDEEGLVRPEVLRTSLSRYDMRSHFQVVHLKEDLESSTVEYWRLGETPGGQEYATFELYDGTVYASYFRAKVECAAVARILEKVRFDTTPRFSGSLRQRRARS